jgi:hypothetical protein
MRRGSALASRQYLRWKSHFETLRDRMSPLVDDWVCRERLVIVVGDRVHLTGDPSRYGPERVHLTGDPSRWIALEASRSPECLFSRMRTGMVNVTL